jgi:transcriptional regulator with XRE-family HTH domain
LSSLKLDKSYNFVDKAPIVDLIRTAIEDSPYSAQRVAELAGLAPATVQHWLAGRTLSPQAKSVEKVAAALGLRFELTPTSTALVPFVVPPKAPEASRRHHAWGWRRWQ